MMTPDSRLAAEKQFNRAAWLTLLIAGALVIYGFATLAYRFTLVTDGWQVNETCEVPAVAVCFKFVKNLMGFPSGLQPGDVAIAVQGQAADYEALAPELRAAWQPGATLTYTVLRAGQPLSVPVTLGHWQVGLWLRATLGDAGALTYQLASFLLLMISTLVFWRRPGNPAAGAFLLLNAALISANLATGTLASGWAEVVDPVAVSLTGPLSQNVMFGVLLPSVLLRFALVFPRPKPSLRRFPWLAHAPLAAGLAFLILSPPGSLLGWFWFLASLVLMVVILGHNFVTMRDPASRAQMLWGLGGVIFGFGVITLLLVASTAGWLRTFNQTAVDLLSAIAFTVMDLTLAIAITRYRLFEIDVILRRTLVYAVLSGLLALVYFGSVVVFEGLLRGVVGGGSQAAIVLSTLLIAALFGPLRGRVQRVIDQRFFRRKYDAARTLAAFGASVRDDVDLDDLGQRLTAVVDETMQPAHVNLWTPAPAQRPKPPAVQP